LITLQKIELKEKEIELIQKTNYPLDGNVRIEVNPEKKEKFNLKIRIPGWSLNNAIPEDLYSFANQPSGSVKKKLTGEM
jgi:DUF1680 family protein